MIFDDLHGTAQNPSPGEHRRRRRRRSGSSDAQDDGGRRRRRRSAFREASRLDEPVRSRGDRNNTAWLVVLVLLIVAALGFAWFLHLERSAPVQLSGEAPSARLLPYIDPILAPLETGTTGYKAEGLEELAPALRKERSKVNIDDQEIYATAANIAQILEEAARDRARHMERLLRLGSPVEGMAPDPQERTDLPETERRHLELAVGVSWQRNSGTYRNQVEELWYRLLRLERGRFREGSAPQSMTPALPPNP